MALIQLTDSVGVDARIYEFQDYLFSTISIDGLVNADDWQCYPRAYKNPWKRDKRPEIYIGGGDYKEVFYDDAFKMSSFFIVSDERSEDNGVLTTEVSLIVQANIQEIFPSIAHRADEELNNEFLLASENYYLADQFRYTRIQTSVENVYREFIKDELWLDDMSEHYVVRFDFEVRYTPECCINC